MNEFYENGNLQEMKMVVKKSTGYDLKQIDITAYTPDFIDYSIYANYENDIRTGRQPIKTGRINL